tara:strand:- start:2265 stop:2888 length:624 start_codon:yes stop_codon:yes gene_type:complete
MSGAYGSGYSRFGSPFGYNPMSGFNQMGGNNQMGGFNAYQPYQQMYAPPMFQNPMFQSYSPFYQPYMGQAQGSGMEPIAPPIIDPIEQTMPPQITAPEPIAPPLIDPMEQGVPFLPEQDNDYMAQMNRDLTYRTAPEGFAWSPFQLGSGRGDQGIEYRLNRIDNLSSKAREDLAGQLLQRRPEGASWSDVYNRQALAGLGRTKDSRF